VCNLLLKWTNHLENLVPLWPTQFTLRQLHNLTHRFMYDIFQYNVSPQLIESLHQKSNMEGNIVGSIGYCTNSFYMGTNHFKQPMSLCPCLWILELSISKLLNNHQKLIKTYRILSLVPWRILDSIVHISLQECSVSLVRFVLHPLQSYHSVKQH
jgi:hypothetical protein